MWLRRAACVPLVLAWLEVALDTVGTFEPDVFPSALRTAVDASVEGGPSNAFSAALLGLLAFSALLNALISFRRGASTVSKAGWAVIALVAGYLSFDELTDFHIAVISRLYLENVNRSLGFLSGFYVWVGLALPIILAFLVFMAFFVRREFTHSRVMQAGMYAGVALWLGKIANEAVASFLFQSRAPALENLLEVGGIVLGSAGLTGIALIHAADRLGAAPPTRREPGLKRLTLSAGLLATAMVAVGLVWGVLRAEPSLNRWSETAVWMGPFQAGSGAIQTLRLPSAPVERIDLIASYSGPEGIGLLDIRLLDSEGVSLREAKLAVPKSNELAEATVRMAALPVNGGAEIALQVAVPEDVPGAFTLSVATSAHPPPGRLYANGQPTPPDQVLNYKLYAPRAPSKAKLAALAQLPFREPANLAILVDAYLVLFFAFASALAVAALLSRSQSRAPSPPRGHSEGSQTTQL